MVEEKQAGDREKVEEGVVACPHHLHHAKISGKLEKKPELAVQLPDHLNVLFK